jgi:histidine ammonia-lyase
VEAAHRHIRSITHHREADYLFQDDLRRIGELVDGRVQQRAAGLGEPTT